MISLIMANRNPSFVQFGALMCSTCVSIDKNTKIIKNITFSGNYCATSYYIGTLNDPQTNFITSCYWYCFCLDLL
ncbi:hypothetical protein NAI33_12570, partial [Francisella tularensis subsp. holarctica]|nr:hypothetical protein [Francisella tularensis subsp. holarctica]